MGKVSHSTIDNMVDSGALSALYDEAKVYELENAEELSGKEAKKLMDMQKNKPLFDAILDALTKNVSEKKYLSWKVALEE